MKVLALHVEVVKGRKGNGHGAEFGQFAGWSLVECGEPKSRAGAAAVLAQLGLAAVSHWVRDLKVVWRLVLGWGSAGKGKCRGQFELERIEVECPASNQWLHHTQHPIWLVFSPSSLPDVS